MKVKFLGATQTVTGSKYLLKVGQKQVLVDCGLFQGEKTLRLRNWSAFPFDATEIDAVIITHAHVDHTGSLPLLVKRGFSGPIYATGATIDLCEILLRDAAHLQEEDARKANAGGYSKHHPALPLYTIEDAEAALELFVPVEFGKAYQIVDNLTASWSRAGHILGSAFVRCRSDETDIVFSGDMGRPHDPILKPPATCQSTDYLVLESTYGDREHDKRDPEEVIGEIAEKTIKAHGTLLIPSFAVGRAQLLLYYFYQLKSKGRLKGIPVYLDSPMAVDATMVMYQNLNEHVLDQDMCAKICGVAHYVRSVEESDLLSMDQSPKIIISASGMATGGRVLNHLKNILPVTNNTVLFSGFQARGTRGEALVNGVDQVKIHGSYHEVKAKIMQLSNLSAHADSTELMGWLKHFNREPRHVFITHGEEASANALKQRIETELGWECSVPSYTDEEEI